MAIEGAITPRANADKYIIVVKELRRKHINFKYTILQLNNLTIF